MKNWHRNGAEVTTTTDTFNAIHESFLSSTQVSVASLTQKNLSAQLLITQAQAWERKETDGGASCGGGGGGSVCMVTF